MQNAGRKDPSPSAHATGRGYRRKCSELFRSGCGTEECAERSVPQANTSFHFDTVRPRRRGAGGRPTLPRWPGAARRAARATDGIKSSCQISKKNKHAHDVPPLSHSTHTGYSCTRSTHVAASACMAACMHGRAHGTTKKRLHEPHKRVAAHVTCTCNYQCLELRNSSEHVQNTSIWLVGTR